MIVAVGIMTTFIPRDLITDLTLSYMVGFCVGLYYQISVGPKSEEEGDRGEGNNGGNDGPPHYPKKKRKGKKKKHKNIEFSAVELE